MSESPIINSTIRDQKGKNAVKKLHREGLIPSVVYGHNFASLSLCVNKSEINKMFKLGHESSEEYKLCKLLIDNKGDMQDRMVIVKEIQMHPVTNAIQHIDFFAVRMDEKITAPVHIHITGKAPGVKEGGILRQILREIEVKGLPTDIPPHFDVDVSGLVRREINLDEAGDKLLDMMVRTANGRMTAAEVLGHREFIMTKLYESA